MDVKCLKGVHFHANTVSICGCIFSSLIHVFNFADFFTSLDEFLCLLKVIAVLLYMSPMCCLCPSQMNLMWS